MGRPKATHEQQQMFNDFLLSGIVGFGSAALTTSAGIGLIAGIVLYVYLRSTDRE